MKRVEEIKILRLSPDKKVKIITIKEGDIIVSSHIIHNWKKRKNKFTNY